jgi:hypothetical protein
MALLCTSFFQVLCFASSEFRWTLVASIYLEVDVKTINFEGMCFFRFGLTRFGVEVKYVSQESLSYYECILYFFQTAMFFNKYDNSHFKNCKAGTMN